MAKRPPPPRTELRKSALRRQWNEAFCDDRGQFSLGKFLALWAQISVLAHMNASWDKLIEKPESLLWILTFLIAPHVITRIALSRTGK